MNEKTLKFGDFEISKKKIHVFKKSFTLNLVDMDKIVISDKFKHSGKGFRN